MSQRLEGRLSRLEATTRATWRAWQGVPAERWPDEALMSCIAETTGLPQPAPGVTLSTWLSDEQLAAIRGGADAATVQALGAAT